MALSMAVRGLSVHGAVRLLVVEARRPTPVASFHCVRGERNTGLPWVSAAAVQSGWWACIHGQAPCIRPPPSSQTGMHPCTCVERCTAWRHGAHGGQPEEEEAGSVHSMPNVLQNLANHECCQYAALLLRTQPVRTAPVLGTLICCRCTAIGHNPAALGYRSTNF